MAIETQLVYIKSVIKSLTSSLRSKLNDEEKKILNSNLSSIKLIKEKLVKVEKTVAIQQVLQDSELIRKEFDSFIKNYEVQANDSRQRTSLLNLAELESKIHSIESEKTKRKKDLLIKKKKKQKFNG